MSLAPRDIPIVLTCSRFVLGPLVLVEAILRAPGWLIATTIIIALLTDIFDGVIARRLKVVTADLRVFDSRADGVYTFSVIGALCLRDWDVVRSNWRWLAVVAACEAVSSIIDQARYGRPCSYHAYTAKLWALSFAVFAVAALAFGASQPYLSICIAIGIVHNVEGWVMRALLPEWTYDVSGIPAAIRLRRTRLGTIRS